MAYAPHLAIALTGEVHFDRRIDRHESLERVQHARVVRVLAGTQANRRIVAREVVELAGADHHGRVHLPGNAAPQESDHAVANRSGGDPEGLLPAAWPAHGAAQRADAKRD